MGSCLREDPIAAAAREGRRRGVCPVWLLDDFCTEHRGFDELCAGFGCAECVADDEDEGPAAPRPAREPETSWEVPF